MSAPLLRAGFKEMPITSLEWVLSTMEKDSKVQSIAAAQRRSFKKTHKQGVIYVFKSTTNSLC